MRRLKIYIITGLAVVTPVVLTIYLLVMLFQFVDGILGSFLNVLLERTLGFYIPGLGFLLFSLLIILVGALTRRFIGHKIFPRLEAWFSGIPMINSIYPTLKQIIRFFLEKKETEFKKVVLLEYPSKGIWSLGFLTNEQFQKMCEVSDRDMVSVFVPTTPGPISGYVVFIPKADIRFPDISVADALKIIVSGGVFKPDENLPL